MNIPTVQAAFPKRPLRIHAPVARWRGWLSALGMLVMAIGFGWWAAASLLPTLLSDYEIRAGAVPAAGRVENGRCTARMGLLQTCSMTLVSAAPTKNGEPIRQGAEYVFAEPHLGDYSVRLLADPSRPGQLTTDMGLDHLGNRAATLAAAAVLVLLLLGGGVLLVRAAGRARRDMEALSGQPLMPVAVVVGADPNGWQVRPAGGGKPTLWPLPKKAEPFWLDAEGRVALGVTAPGLPVFALDRDLAWADFSEEEREGLRRAAAA
ncbi:hypothetical protein EAH89_14680 [Roseomonas nepalensis]|uniref:Uncharacterized protein n=1 Tax=Muricoccus nepalensis TaxID=1854500 RepID=A0A502G1Q5_9PROT|nr:hypothetical protein [Roseomonas nepalensis]TPG55492.1 hypothetical protein EAH89_14680 [Roseomonas nepalensis]